MRIKQPGFTLLEVMVVIAIIAILATLAIPSQIGAITQRRVLESKNLVEPYKGIIGAYFLGHAGEFPEDNEAAGLPEPNKILGNYLEKMEVRDGVMHLYLGQKMPAKLHHKIVSIRPIFVKDSPLSPIDWVCGKDEVPLGMTAAGINLTDLDVQFLPGSCR
jgi:type IV pilus assembly protein PilA